MHARKIRYDDSFIADEKSSNVKDKTAVSPATGSPPQYTESPARQLQQQLKAQYVDQVEGEQFEKYSGLSSLSIIVGSSLIMWLGLASFGFYIFR